MEGVLDWSCSGQAVEDEGVGAVYGGGVQGGEVDSGGRFGVVAHSSADDAEGDAFGPGGGGPAVAGYVEGERDGVYGRRPDSRRRSLVGEALGVEPYPLADGEQMLLTGTAGEEEGRGAAGVPFGGEEPAAGGNAADLSALDDLITEGPLAAGCGGGAEFDFYRCHFTTFFMILNIFK